MTTLHALSRKLKKKDLTQQHRNSRNSTPTKMTASKHSCKDLTPTESTDYSISKATKKQEHAKKLLPFLRTSQGTWAGSNSEKAYAFANHLADGFQPHPSENKPEEEEALIQLLEFT
jgi:hypothetical protein